ncbi:MAG TPA: aminotransferase class I/II-fold pyridoxal phosphate-dependent enzyme [Hyphomicrobiaceae bacterium]|nr:aminotransferase class I/II-fold pyridoxal phosphate-dependent enzyme [Hyphomicrobiaceae bacterium]
MPTLARRPWVPPAVEDVQARYAASAATLGSAALQHRIEALADRNREIHEKDCFNLNPATNTMNPRAEALLASGLGVRPSLGYAGDKYEMGLEACEEIEVITAELAAEVFGAKFAEIRVPSGAIANLYAFMSTCQPGDAVIVPPAEIGGHVTHHRDGAAGLYGVAIHPAPIDAAHYTVDVARLAELAERVKPKLITIGASLNLLPHPVRELRAIADRVGAKLLFDAAHMSGLIAGRAWQQPLAEGAHLMTMSTYKSLGGPPAGLVLTNDAKLAQRIDRIAFPGLTANFDVSKAAALAVTLLDWREYGRAYAAKMVEMAKALAEALAAEGLPVHRTAGGFTTSHQFAIEAHRWGGGQAASKLLRRANILACGIGLPIAAVDGDNNGLRIGTPEIVRWGFDVQDCAPLARLVARVLAGNEAPEAIAPDVTAMRHRFTKLSYVC